ncbi:MAG: RNA polymerase sigma factor [Bacteroidota bacterium]|nr:RNA polymerase sigma factor [Bacteroidota bacterium]
MIRRNPSAEMHDEQIIYSILDGKKDDYELLMRRYNVRLYRIGISIVKNEEEVEDLMQETYIKAYQQLKNFKHKSKFSTWLCRIMINESLGRVKRKSKFESYTENDTEEAAPLHAAVAANTVTPEKQLLQKELASILENAIQKIPPTYKTVFILREIEKLSVQETALCLNISTENVKVRLHRAKDLIKSHLSNFSEEIEIFPFPQTRCDRIVNAVLQKI